MRSIECDVVESYRISLIPTELYWNSTENSKAMGVEGGG